VGRSIIVSLVLAAGCAKAPGGTDAPRNTAPTREQHDKRFPILAGVHAVDCNSCHGAFDSFRAFDCLGCHVADPTSRNHAARAGYSYDSSSCYTCHPRGSAAGGGANHGAFFPIDPSSKHAFGTVASSCSDCHADASDRKKTDCISCHAQAASTSQHARVEGFQWLAAGTSTSALCLRCHADAQVKRLTTHLPFNVLPPSRHSIRNAAAGNCLGCHAAARADKPYGQDFTQKDYLGCHAQPAMDDKHIGRVTGYRYDTPTCLASGCHSSGGRRGP
jgi:hypothetical protein